ncbi:MAG: hypothetical protein K6G94_05395 [Kiritimatiellae bacterium]|nr:hypothetical protein [Kiritimatiellia bacterium]
MKQTIFCISLCAAALPAVAAAEALGLAGVKPIGKWTTGTNGTTHWVVEELPAGLSVSLR